ncbi:unnamed protein product [Musa textilis]
MLTDCVFWLIIFPFLAIRDYNLNFVLICMHSLNAVFLLGDIALNSLSFPWFRIAYFLLWTAIYVIFQWVIHACVDIWWPYPFLDLSSTYAPVFRGGGDAYPLLCCISFDYKDEAHSTFQMVSSVLFSNEVAAY